MLLHVFLPVAAFGPQMLLWGGPDDLRTLTGHLTGFAAAPLLSSLTQGGICAAVDGRAIWLVPSIDRLGLRAASGSGGDFHWRMSAAVAQRFAALSLSLAGCHPASGHQYLDGDADQEITVCLSLNEYPPDFKARQR